MTILIIHYHLRPGGVTRVIESQVRALHSLGHKVTIASSGPASMQWPCDHLLVEDLDYQKEGFITLKSSDLLQFDLCIIHNPTLGLNVAYPDLIEDLAQSGIPLLLQIHDFAEDGRPENFQLLGEREKIYPLAPHIHYATVNRRDRQILISAGIPKSQCHHLPNAINPPTLPKITPQENLVFYPVRGIRRKNLGELCLLAAHAPPGTQFAVALRSGSEEPPHLHDDWVKFAENLNLPIQFDVTNDDPTSFPTWLARSTHFITTSICEGFGLTFLDPAFLKKPLIGRDLPEITQDFATYGTLYQKIPIPLSSLPKLREIYFSELQKTMSSYGLSLSKDQITSAWQSYTAHEQVDFGNLPESLQRKVILGDPIPELTDWLAKALQEPATKIDTTPWSLKTYTARLDQITTSFPSNGPVTWLDKSKILPHYLHPKRFHFLRSQLSSDEP